jgi:protein SCO1/2
LRKALVEASAGSIGSAWDRIVLWCYSYDPSSNKYVVAARKVMFAGGIVTVLLTFGTLALLWRREMKSRRNLALGGLES